MTRTSPITARLPNEVAGRLANYCATAGLSRTTVLVNALREFLAAHQPQPTAYQLAMELLKRYGDEPGLPHIQARDAKHILREKMRKKARAR